MFPLAQMESINNRNVSSDYIVQYLIDPGFILRTMDCDSETPKTTILAQQAKSSLLAVVGGDVIAVC